MHELSVCQEIVMQVERIARERQARVSSITLRIGPLSGVEPALLQQAYPLASAGTCLSAALAPWNSVGCTAAAAIRTARGPEPDAVRTVRRLAHRIAERRRTTAGERGVEPDPTPDGDPIRSNAMCQLCGCSLPGTEMSRIAPSHPRTRAALSNWRCSRTCSQGMTRPPHTIGALRHAWRARHQLHVIAGAGKTSLLEATIRRLRTQYRSASWKATSRPRTMPGAFARRACRQSRSPPATPAISTRPWSTALCTRSGSPTSICCSSRTSATWCARPVSIWDSTAMSCSVGSEGDDKPEKYPVMFRRPS